MNSSVGQQLSNEDIRALADALNRIATRARFRTSLDRLVQEWWEFVGQVERGYQDNEYEYRNDASARGVIEEIANSLSEDGRARILSLVADADAAFLRATVPWGDSGGPFWRTRIPIHRTDEFMDDDIGTAGQE